MRALIAALLTVCAVPAAAQNNCGQLPKTGEGKAYAVSGDTLAGIGLKPRLRLWGLRAPELGAEMSVPAMRARAALEDRLAAGEHPVSCRMTGWDRQCRHAQTQHDRRARGKQRQQNHWPRARIA